MVFNEKFFLVMLWCVVTALASVQAAQVTPEHKDVIVNADMDTAATSAKLFNLGSLLGQNPNYGYGNGYYRPTYPNTGAYPNTGSYYPSTGYYPNAGSYYPNTGSYYPSGGYYPSTGTGSYYPSITGGSYYPTTSTYPGTNILGYGGNGGYGGYNRGNGGLRQYSGYWNPEYMGQRNLGYGYYTNTDRYGLPTRPPPPSSLDGFNVGGASVYSRDRVAGSYRGYD